MEREWLSTTLGELGDLRNGANFSANDYGEDHPVVSVKSLFRGRYAVTEGLDAIKSGVIKTIDNFLLQENDILFARSSLKRSGSGQSAILRKPPQGTIFSGFTIRFRVKKDVEAFPLFLFYYFQSPQSREIFARIATGTTISNLSQANLGSFPIKLPSLLEQKAITHTLGTLDDKIELNRQTNKTLETMAQALFKSWFVDFDPVIDNALAAGNPIPEVFAERAKLRAAAKNLDSQSDSESAINGASRYQHLFPAEFEFSEEMGWVPKGWEVEAFGSVSQCFDRKRIPLSKKQRRDKQPGDIPYYGATSVMDFVNDFIFDDIYLLIGEDGSVVKEDGSPFVQYIWGKSWVNNHAHVLQGKGSISTEHLMLFMQSQDINAYVTGAVQLKINQKNMNSIPFLLASNDINDEFSKLIKEIYQKIRSLSDNNRPLTKLRDTLLPKLLSGELRIPDAEKVIQASVWTSRQS